MPLVSPPSDEVIVAGKEQTTEVCGNSLANVPAARWFSANLVGFPLAGWLSWLMTLFTSPAESTTWKLSRLWTAKHPTNA